MAIKLTNTKSLHTQGIKVLVYGEAGMGKTKLCATAPNPVIISAESGLLSLAGKDIPVIEVKSIEDVHEAYAFLQSEEGKQFDTICLDSISEVAEVVLNTEKKNNKDPRAAYGALIEVMTDLIRAFRDIEGKNVYFSCKQGLSEDSFSGITRYGPMMPGQRLTQEIAFFFDEVFCLRIGKTDEGLSYRYLQTQPDIQYTAKDRSGVLDEMVKPDLTDIFNTIVKGE